MEAWIVLVQTMKLGIAILESVQLTVSGVLGINGAHVLLPVEMVKCPEPVERCKRPDMAARSVLDLIMRLGLVTLDNVCHQKTLVLTSATESPMTQFP